MPGDHDFSEDLPKRPLRPDEFAPEAGADDRDYSAAPPQVPGLVRTAGSIWILFGSLMIVNALINFAMAGAQGGGGGGCGGLLGLGFAVAFIYVGWQSVKGTAKDTMGNGIGSIVIGLLNGGFGVLVLVGAVALAAGQVPPPQPGAPRVEQGIVVLLFVAGGISAISGIGLVVAGILALMARPAYKAYRRGIKRLRPIDE